MKIRIALIAAWLAMSLVSVAQDMPSMEPPPELKKLEWMLGDWTIDSHWDMNGQEFDSAGTLKVSWEGQFLKMVSSSDMMGAKFDETSYLGYDAKEKKYVLWSFTNWAPTPRVERGNFEGEAFVTVSDPWDVAGQTVTGRATQKKVSDTEATMTLEFKMGDSWVKVAESKAKKKAS
jgi:hypothetical protein